MFPLSQDFRALCSGPGCVRETHAPFDDFLYSERHLQALWYDVQYRPTELVTMDGERVTVEHPGDWNLEAGPDFLGASLLLSNPQRRIAGDVEIHIRPADWRAHRHGNDPRYDNVCLHVCYFPGVLDADELPPGCLQLSLRSAIRAIPDFSFENIDPMAYPYAVRGPETPCSRILRDWDEERRGALLDAAGQERLRVKTLRIRSGIAEHGAEQAFYEEFLCALGYKNNKIPFRTLAIRLPLQYLRRLSGDDPLRAYAVLLGCSGLLPTALGEDWSPDGRKLIRQCWDHWWPLAASLEPHGMSFTDWQIGGMRPTNAPMRRLMAAAWLFCSPTRFPEQFLQLDSSSPKKWLQQLAPLLACTDAPYWPNYLSLSGEPLEKPIQLLGRDRIAALTCNVFLPFFVARHPSAAPVAFHELPAESQNRLMKRTAESLFGLKHNARLYSSALRRQGLLEIFQDFCMPDRSRCNHCQLTLKS